MATSGQSSRSEASLCFGFQLREIFVLWGTQIKLKLGVVWDDVGLFSTMFNDTYAGKTYSTCRGGGCENDRPKYFYLYNILMMHYIRELVYYVKDKVEKSFN